MASNQLPPINIGQYTRPGIFIQEYDQSVVTSPTFQGITNLVIGCSRQGPINSPVLLQNINDLTNIFGNIDRSLERNGSFFQRTIAQMLQSSPVWGMNLLTTNDSLDLLQYVELSSSTNNPNDIIRTAPYRLFYDTKGFWEQSTEAFQDLTETQNGGQPLPYYNTDVINLTNYSGQYITVFMFHTQVSGYNTTMISWYGTIDNMPSYVNQLDWVSDYMVDIVVVSGDWTNYTNLSVSPIFGQFFNNEGLITSQVTNFTNNSNVSLLAYYQGVSLIPYFRNANGANIFIEQIINADTNTTGLFCAFNMDVYETNYPNGLVDLIGNNIATTTATSINFLSYSASIIDTVAFAKTYLDTPSNVIGFGGFGSYEYYGPNYRTGYYGEGVINGVSRDYLSHPFTYSTSAISVQYDTTINNSPLSINGDTTFIPAYAIIGGNLIQVGPTMSFTISVASYPGVGATLSYTSVFALNTSGVFYKTDSFIPSVNPTIATTDLPLGYVTFNVFSASIVGAPVFTDVTVGTAGYIDLTFGTGSNDYYITYLGTSSINYTFNNTAEAPNPANYKQYRRFKTFNGLLNLLDSPNVLQSTMALSPSTSIKQSIAGMTLSNIQVATTGNLSFNLETGLTSSQLNTILTTGYSLFYDVDNEFILGTNQLFTTNNPAPIGLTYGIAAQYSTFYQDFYNGDIETGDYFYDNLIGYSPTGPTYDVTYNITFLSMSGSNYIAFYNSTFPLPTYFRSNTGDGIIIPASVLNNSVYTLQNYYFNASFLGLTAGYSAWQVAQSVTSESLLNVSTVWDTSAGPGPGKHYLQMFTDGYENLNVTFTDSTLELNYPIPYEATEVECESGISVWSEESNFKETVEIIVPVGYASSINTILCDAARYSNISVYDFLEAYVDPSTLVSGQQPRNLTRIISKTIWSGTYSNAGGQIIQLAQIVCDSQINVFTYSGSLQTNRYTTIDDYVDTYQGIRLMGFRVRSASLPDGTEATQNTILNLIANGTPLANALTNKDAFDFHYMVDSFGLGLISQSKQQLMDICGNRLNCFGFLNMPSLNEFQQSSSPSFVDQNGVLQTAYIAEGGNPQSNPAFLYSFGTGLGTTCTGYFTPYLTINDNGRPLNVPPSMFVGTTYMNKFNSNLSNIVPWTVSAGITNGRIQGIAGVEMDFIPQDISNLNQAQMNPIVMKRNRGYVIETENTAQTLYTSSLSFIHCREVLIQLENQLYDMLLGFQWQFNTQDVRSEIKLRADTICQTFVNQNGLYNYFNKCDQENNTPNIIDNQMGVLNTYVEVVKAMGVIVNQLTILRTGAISSSGFISQ